ncbi:nuclear RNA export factor 1 [Drosophila subobscura]|uniref:nuclear RNA export factor 1 n=1 Tax=Drosophila subobscura TaxID=7241 RepID=UPI00155AC62F|nr:nuclear RNA export factor 1 [Drosophila subobscura]
MSTPRRSRKFYPRCHSTPNPERSLGRDRLPISAFGWYRVLVFSRDHRETISGVFHRLRRLTHSLTARYTHLGGETDAMEDAGAFLTFYVNDATEARELHGLSSWQLGHLKVRVNGRMPWMRLTPWYSQSIRNAVLSRHDPIRQSLDLTLFHLDPEWRNDFCALAQPSCLRAVIAIVAEEMPHLVRLRLDKNYLRNLRPFFGVERRLPRLQCLSLANNELDDCLSELQVFRFLPLIELNLSGNRLPPSHERSVRNEWPRLRILNNIELYPRPHQRISSSLHNSRGYLVTRLCQETGMNAHWSRGALEVNDWNYSRTLRAFWTFHRNGQIPQKAFDSA